MKTKNKVLIIAAHPDDEILGCGATMARHIAEGDQVEVIIVAEGITSRSNKRDTKAAASALKKLQETALKANQILGVKNVQLLGLPDNRLDSMDLLDLVKAIEEKVQKINPTIIYTHFPSDLNIDHQRIAQAVLTACRPQPGSKLRDIFYFEVPSATEWFPGGPLQGGYFHPNRFVNVDKTLSKKLKALEVYHEEMRDFPHARSIEAVEALAKWRGTSVGFKAAEAFQIARSLEI